MRATVSHPIGILRTRGWARQVQLAALGVKAGTIWQLNKLRQPLLWVFNRGEWFKSFQNVRLPHKDQELWKGFLPPPYFSLFPSRRIIESKLLEFFLEQTPELTMQARQDRPRHEAKQQEASGEPSQSKFHLHCETEQEAPRINHNNHISLCSLKITFFLYIFWVFCFVLFYC